MIKVKLTKNNNYYKRIIITGHANYDDFGKDIVCAAVSSTVITSVNSCLAIDNESISYEDKNGLDIKVLKDDEYIERMPKEKIDTILLYNEQDVVNLFKILTSWGRYMKEEVLSNDNKKEEEETQ